MSSEQASDPGEHLTEYQKAKIAFAMHQDALYWSRTQLLVSVQGAVLAGVYLLTKELRLAEALTVFGILLSFLIYAMMVRDDVLGEAAFKESRLRKTNPIGIWAYWPKGKLLTNIAIVMLIVADLWLLWHVDADLRKLLHGWLDN